MKDKTKIRILAALVGVCFMCIAGLSYYTWHMKSNATASAIRMDQYDPSNSLTLPALPDAGLKDWNPWFDEWGNADQFMDLQKRMDEMMGQMLPGGSIFSQRGFGLSSASPEVKLKELKDAYEVEVILPQGQEVELNTHLEKGVLTISGKVKSTDESVNGNTLGRQTSISQFSQSITLVEPVRESGISINRGDEIITVRVPKKHT
ncbi:Hsp20/alpha crystallin family protein [Neptunomonas qingdaonensis]|uniref:Molecular chaperone IbpA, HSP20 family n=1 Tax=Neptunomonas qingdaonensis TaxID=1045558 RepID=A0A1I2V7T9_9GAMM|nr:Hsp20/alpha crystallin family protein [Neptunomonas qingdaonensis]SFG84277.1 Molecular chaperone IbpA, HSP20 family [Neptunomonas qingdaonensis]